MKKLTLIIPCYNEQESIPIFYRESTRVLKSLDCDYEMIFVNDSSKDQTLAVLKQLADTDSHIVYLSFSRNFGKEAAMYAGLNSAVAKSGEEGHYIAVMDADMQDPLSLLPQMLEILETGDYDNVATRRANRAGEPPVRSWFARRFYKIINQISDSDIVDGARDFRLMKMWSGPQAKPNGTFGSFLNTPLTALSIFHRRS